MKRFLIVGTDSRYGSYGSDNWIGVFETREEAEKIVKEAEGREGVSGYTFLTGENYEHAEVVDLQEWIDGNRYEHEVEKQREWEKQREGWTFKDGHWDI